MEKDLLLVSLRNGALYLESQADKAEPVDPDNPDTLTPSTVHCLEQLMSHGYLLDKKATLMLNRLQPSDQTDVIEMIRDVYNSDQNWAALVKDWHNPTYETVGDHLITLVYNTLIRSGEIENHGEATLLPCGHYIPKGTFDIERYTGCPFCGTPFETSDKVYLGQASHFKVLRAWTDRDAYNYFKDLLQSTVPPSPTDISSLKILLDVYEMPDVDIPMRETAIVAALALINHGEKDKASKILKTPADILRMLWYEKTGQRQVLKPMTMLRAAKNYGYHISPELDKSIESVVDMYNAIKLKYSRQRCRMVAALLNEMDISADKACETMHPRRGMWVRVIRALRLAEYAKKPGNGRLGKLLDTFYKGNYYVAQGQIDLALDMHKYHRAAELLSQRPGIFARSLFSLMLKYNPYRVLGDFRSIIDKIPLRLLVSLGNNAEIYFKNDSGKRLVRTSTGIELMVPVNPNISLLGEEERLNVIDAVKGLTLDALERTYAKSPEPGQKIYISPELQQMVLPVGQRPQTIQDAMYVPQGTKFKVEGDKVRLFLHWGKGMKAAPIDLDISAAIVYDDKTVPCSYYNLSPKGAQHSGDMRAIPDDVGTAEYIELDLPVLAADKARYVVFTANQYSNGKLLANAMAGWMESKYPMQVSNETGVAYDPSCVQHFVKVDDTQLTKGLVFGVLDVRKREIMYIEMSFEGQSIANLDILATLTLINKLSKKLTIGKALETMAKARQMTVVTKKEDIDEDTRVYDRAWALNMPEVARVLLPERTETIDQ